MKMEMNLQRATTANITSSTEVPAAFPVLSQKSPTPAPTPAPLPVNTIVNKPEEQNEGIVTQSEKFPTMKPIEDLPIIKRILINWIELFQTMLQTVRDLHLLNKLEVNLMKNYCLIKPTM